MPKHNRDDAPGSLIDSLRDLLPPDQFKRVVDRLRPLLPRDNIPPGRTLPPRFIDAATVQAMLLPALIVAAGYDPARTASPPPPVLWDDGSNRLLVHLDAAVVACGRAFVDVTVPVECDQTKRVPITCTFVTSDPARPGGAVFATESRARGPEAVSRLWSDALIALSWRSLVEIARNVAAAAGTDTFGRPLVAVTVVATPDGLGVTPMAAHPFMKVG